MARLTKAQLKMICTLIRKQNLIEMKEGLVSQFTDGRTVHVSEMYYSEAGEFIQQLSKSDPLFKMRNKVRAIAHDLGWLMKGEHEFNRYVIDRFLEERGTVKKQLSKMNSKELTETVTQFEKIKLRNDHSDWVKTELAKTLNEFNIIKSGKKLKK